jgi:transposase-like protein
MTIFDQAKQAAAPRVVDVVEKRFAAVALRRQGYTYERIAKRIGISHQTAWQLVIKALEERRRELAEAVDDVRDMEIIRLDKMSVILFKRLDDPENDDPERTVNSLLKIMERRAALLGLDAPKDYRFTPGGPAVPVGGDVDVSKLTTEQLRELEQIREKYDQLVAASTTIALPAGDPVSVVEPPTEAAKCSA